MKSKPLVFIAISLASASVHAQYKDGWTTQNFYEGVNLCRSSIIFPAAKDYEAAGIKNGMTRFALRNEVIANTPTFEMVASEACYCALNQYAKDYAYSDMKVRKGDFAEYMRTPQCKSKMTKAMELIKSDPKAHTLP